MYFCSIPPLSSFWTQILLFVMRVTQSFSQSLWLVWLYRRLRLECDLHPQQTSEVDFKDVGFYLWPCLCQNFISVTLCFMLFPSLFYSQCRNLNPSIEHGPSKTNLGQCGLLYTSLFRVKLVLHSKLDQSNFLEIS